MTPSAMLHLIWILSLKELKQRYHQRLLKAAWAFIHPLFQLTLFTLIFSKLVRFDSEGAPYTLFAFCALLPWGFFSACLSSSCYSLTSNRNLITRLHFPRVTIPLSVLLTHAVDFAIAALLFSVFFAWQGTPSNLPLLSLVPVLGIQVLFTAGMCLFLSVGNAYFRDVGSSLPTLTQAWLLASPVVYSTAAVPEKWRPLYFLNPVAAIIDGYRSVLLHGRAPEWPPLLGAFAVSAGVFVAAWLIFKKLEADLADVV